MNVNKNIKKSMGELNVSGRKVKHAHVKANLTDAGGNFYIFDLKDNKGHTIAINRYVYKNGDNQPFDELTESEELKLNPPVTEPEKIL